MVVTHSATISTVGIESNHHFSTFVAVTAACLCKSYVFFPSPILFCLRPIIVCSPFYIFPGQITFAHAALVAFLQPFKGHRQYSIHTGVQPHCWIALYTSVNSLIWLSTVFGPWLSLISFPLQVRSTTVSISVCLFVSLFLSVSVSLLSFRGSTRAPANPG